MSDENGPRLIGRKEAAAYLGIAESTFSMWVATQKMPPTIYGTRRWDKRAIDAKLDEISGLADSGTEDRYTKWMRENAKGPGLEDWRKRRDERRSGTVPSSGTTGTDVARWRAQKEKRRAKYRPQMAIDSRLQNVLIFMLAHPECDTAVSIPGTGQVGLDALIGVGAVRLVGTEKGAFRYALTDEGTEEAKRIKKWRSLSPD